MSSKLMAAAVAVAAIFSAPGAHAQQFINVLTGGTSGVYYPLGVAIGKIYSDKIPNVKTQVQATKASVENLDPAATGPRRDRVHARQFAEGGMGRRRGSRFQVQAG